MGKGTNEKEEKEPRETKVKRKINVSLTQPVFQRKGEGGKILFLCFGKDKTVGNTSC